MIKELIHKGCKAVLYKISAENQNEKFEETKFFSCNVHDIMSSSEILLYNGIDTRVMLNKQECYILEVYATDGVYRCSAYFTSEFIENSEQYIMLEIVSPLHRIQRRRHQRYLCHKHFFYYVLQDSQIRDIITREYTNENKDFLNTPQMFQGTIIDMSGGGMRFTTKNKIKSGRNIFCLLNLDDKENKDESPVLCRVVYSDRLANDKDNYDIRVKYVDITEEQRKKIIKYIFWLERKRME